MAFRCPRSAGAAAAAKFSGAVQRVHFRQRGITSEKKSSQPPSTAVCVCVLTGPVSLAVPRGRAEHCCRCSDGGREPRHAWEAPCRPRACLCVFGLDWLGLGPERGRGRRRTSAPRRHPFVCIFLLCGPFVWLT